MSPADLDPGDGARTSTAPEPREVAVEGRDRVVVTRSGRFPRETRSCTVECASGQRRTDEWTGVPVAALAGAAAFPDGTTHVRVAAADFAADVAIRRALDGLVAFERRSDRDGGEPGVPRFVADGVAGERLVKRVRRITAVALAPGEEPRVG